MILQKQMIAKLEHHFTPDYLSVINESHQHRVAPGSETHFKVVIISSTFQAKRVLARHREVYQVLAEELQQGVHALALHTYTPEEWLAKGECFPLSPKCAGSGK